METASVPTRRTASKMHPVVHLLANLLALSLLVISLLSERFSFALGGVVVFVFYCALESWSVARHRRDLIQ